MFVTPISNHVTREGDIVADAPLARNFALWDHETELANDNLRCRSTKLSVNYHFDFIIFQLLINFPIFRLQIFIGSGSISEGARSEIGEQVAPLAFPWQRTDAEPPLNPGLLSIEGLMSTEAFH